MSADLGVLVLDENGARLENISVTLSLIGPKRWPLTEETGKWGVATFSQIEPGTYMLSIGDPRYAGASQFVTVRNNSSQQAVLTLYPVRKIYFAIYYKVKDGAFQRAAETWAREVRGRSGYSSRNDKVLLIEQLSEGDFKKAWNLIYQEGKLPGRKVVEGRLFSHASYMSNTDGLEFKGDETGGTLDRKEMSALPRLNWESGGTLGLHGCNTGKSGMRGWTPAQELANSQGVTVEALSGWGYFSTRRDSYEQINDSSQTVYLYAYDRKRNGLLGNGSKNNELVFRPQ